MVKDAAAIAYWQRFAYMGSWGGILAQIELESGIFGWRQELDGPIVKVVMLGPVVYSLTHKNGSVDSPYTLFAMAADSGASLWTREVPASSSFSKIVINENSILLLHSKELIRLDPVDGTIIFHRNLK